MKALNRSLIVAAFGCALIFVAPMSARQQKLAQTGMKFLNIGTDARITGMGEAFTAIEGTSSAMFYNPAGMARLGGIVGITLGQTKWIADINQSFASVAVSPFHGDYGVFGLSIASVNYGSLDGTIVAPNAAGYIDVGTFTPTAIMVGLGYAIALSDRFSIGANVKYVTQDLGTTATDVDQAGNPVQTSNKTSVPAFDLGVLYRTGLKSLNFGMTVRNFSREARYQKEGFQLPLIFRIGLSMNVLDMMDMSKDNALLVGVEATHPRDYPEQVIAGAEYTFLQLLSLRLGYVYPADEQSMSYGAGVQQDIAGAHLAVDYSYTPFGVFNKVNRISFRFTY